MSPLGLTDTAVTASLPSAATNRELQLRLYDVLASTQRLWVRGRLAEGAGPSRHADASWWERWWTRKEPDPAPVVLDLQTQIGGSTFQSLTPVDSSGYFEALLPASLPPARRGWRIARHQVSLGNREARACGVVLAAPAADSQVVVVLLPLAFTYEQDGARRLGHSEQARRLARGFQPSGPGRSSGPAIYYVGSVPPDAEGRQAQLALAATALGWPAGHFVLVPATPGEAAAALIRGLDRLRWLFASTQELFVVNEEPSLAATLGSEVHPVVDRATISRVCQPEEGLGLAAEPGREPRPRPSGPVLRPIRSSRVPRYPVVFCHGMLAMSTLRMQLPENTNYFHTLQQFLQDRGVRALYPQVEPTGGVETRARQLCEQIQRWTEEPVNLIAHSMGGLDCRHLITHLGMADRVRSLTTISTPHHGSPLADWFCANFGQRIPLLLTLQALGMNVDGVSACRLAECRDFNARTPDAPGVSYFSFGAAVSHARVTPFLRRAWDILTPLEGPNDGLVSVTSARWGEYLGTLSVDHFAQTPDGLFIKEGETFDSLGFFTRVVEDLARRGY